MRTLLAFIIGFLLGCLLALALNSYADRCQQYIQPVRVQHYKYFGLNYPYWYGIGQLKQESSCRANITAFDGGMGLAQLMPATARYVEQSMNINLDFYNAYHAIKAQAWYMAKLHRQNWDGALWLTYQAYNGGWKWLKKEYQNAGYVDHELMYIYCVRKPKFCDTNYNYSNRVYGYGQRYKTFNDGIWGYW